MNMPELPEVQTTVMGLRRHTIGLTITDVWSGYNSVYFKGSQTIKDREFFEVFKTAVVGSKIIAADRRAKNILIHLDNKHTILIHMKMTGHLLFGKYRFDSSLPKDPWVPIEPASLKDPYNRHVRFIIALSNGYYLALSDVRRFAKVTFDKTEKINGSVHLKDIGPEPLTKKFTLETFKNRLATRPNSKIKQVLTDQTVIAGIGNIYADESLWRADIHPHRKASDLNSNEQRKLYSAIISTLTKGIDFGGDSMSDYRNINGEKGHFQEHHSVYRKKGQKCSKPGCTGTIVRIVVGGRGTHLCNKHQV